MTQKSLRQAWWKIFHRCVLPKYRMEKSFLVSCATELTDQRIAFGGAGKVGIWNIATNKWEKVFVFGSNTKDFRVKFLFQFHDGNIAICLNKEVIVWDSHENKKLFSIESFPYPFIQLPANNYIISGFEEKEFTVWAINEDGFDIITQRKHCDERTSFSHTVIQDIQYFPANNSHSLISGSLVTKTLDSIKVWSIHDWSCLIVYSEEYIRCMVVTQQKIIFGEQSSTLSVWYPARSTKLVSPETDPFPIVSRTTMDGSLLHVPQFMDLTTEVSRDQYLRHYFQDLLMLSDGTTLVSRVIDDPVVTLWSIPPEPMPREEDGYFLRYGYSSSYCDRLVNPQRKLTDLDYGNSCRMISLKFGNKFLTVIDDWMINLWSPLLSLAEEEEEIRRNKEKNDNQEGDEDDDDDLIQIPDSL